MMYDATIINVCKNVVDFEGGLGPDRVINGLHILTVTFLLNLIFVSVKIIF